MLPTATSRQTMTTTRKIASYKNGNALIDVFQDGTREIEFPESGMQLDMPLNVDIRVSNQCSFGYNENTKSAICDFCHESAVTSGKECDYGLLQYAVSQLLVGTELAIGCNNLTDGLFDFILWASGQGYIVNLTINQGHTKRDLLKIMNLMRVDAIMGLGVSYRSDFAFNVPQEILNYPHTVFHVIAGIDDVDDIMSLKEKGVNKILILGEKDFGFNFGRVQTESPSHLKWRFKLRELMSLFSVTSFDNLAIEQVKPKRFLTQDNWDTFYQGEHSFYIDAINSMFKRSSRHADGVDFKKITVKEYFQTIDK